MKYSMIISDFDGTLAEKAQIPEQSVKAIKKYVDKGGKFIICTGRMYQSIKNRMDEYGLKGIVACHQGAHIVDSDTGNTIYSVGMNKEFAVQAVKLAPKECTPLAYIGADIYCERPCRYAEVFKDRCSINIVSDLSETLLNATEPIYRMIYSTEPDYVQGFLDKYSKIFEGKLIVNSGASYIVELVGLNQGKGNAVKFLAKYLNIPYDKIMTVGDSTNDIPLLDGEWHGVAVGTSHQDLKRVAKEITVPFNEFPIKYLIEKYGG